jgi:hypothetical protein
MRYDATRARLEALLATHRASAEVGDRLRKQVDDLRAEHRRMVVHRKNE